jgi:hypothetical protein
MSAEPGQQQDYNILHHWRFFIQQQQQSRGKPDKLRNHAYRKLFVWSENAGRRTLPLFFELAVFTIA